MKYSVTTTFLLVLTVSLLGAGCSKKSEDKPAEYNTDNAEAISGAISAAANAADNGGSVVAWNKSSGEKKPFKIIAQELLQETFASKAWASSCFVSASVLTNTCVGSVMSIDLNGCTGFLGGTWDGTATLTFNNATTCANAHSGGLLNMGVGSSVTVTSPQPGISRVGMAGYKFTNDSDPSGYASSLSGGTQVTCNSTDCNSGAGRQVNILGVHRTLYNPTGHELYDHTINTPTPLNISGFGGNKVISSGSVQVQHNILRYTASASIIQPLTFSALCCHPTGGQVRATFTSGSRSGSEVVTFGPTCGVASVEGHSFSLISCM